MTAFPKPLTVGCGAWGVRQCVGASVLLHAAQQPSSGTSTIWPQLREGKSILLLLLSCDEALGGGTGTGWYHALQYFVCTYREGYSCFGASSELRVLGSPGRRPWGGRGHHPQYNFLCLFTTRDANEYLNLLYSKSCSFIYLWKIMEEICYLLSRCYGITFSCQKDASNTVTTSH